MDRSAVLKTNIELQNKLQGELIKQKGINEKLKLADELNQSLKYNIFHIFIDILSFQNMVFKNN